MNKSANYPHLSVSQYWQYWRLVSVAVMILSLCLLLLAGELAGTARASRTTARAAAVKAIGAQTMRTLTVSKTGDGSGTVTSTPAGINCGANCSADFNDGQMVTLTATPSQSLFVGWSGACTGMGICTVTMAAAKSVTARFSKLVPEKCVNENPATWGLRFNQGRGIQPASCFQQCLAGGGTGYFALSVNTGNCLCGTPTKPKSLAPNVGGCTSNCVGSSALCGGGSSLYSTYDLSAPINPTCPSITLTPSALTTGMVGAIYSKTLTPGGGSAPLTFNVTGLPPGLTTSATATSVTLSGRPTQPGSFKLTVTATDSNGCTGSRSYTLNLGVPGDVRRSSDFDGDYKTDYVIWRPTTSEWLMADSSTGATVTKQWGAGTDLPVPQDYEGDGRTDLAIWRPSTGEWWISYSSSGDSVIVAKVWGTLGDVPAPGDYDGDGQGDLAIWRPATGVWWISYSSNGATVSKNLGALGDVPVPGDYDGDGKTDCAIWRPATGQWMVSYSFNGASATGQWGAAGDVAVPGDYDGDSRTDYAIWRPATGVWWIYHSSNGAAVSHSWGAAGDVPRPGDYDGDRKTDLAIWRPATGVWWVYYLSTGGTMTKALGIMGEMPVR